MKQIKAGSATETARASFERAAGYLQNGNAKKAADICRSALARFPGDSEIRCLLGMALTGQGKPGSGLKQLRIVVKQFPDFAMGHEQLGNTLLVMRKPDAAVESFRNSLRINPRQAPLHTKLGRILSTLGRDSEAQAAIAKGSALGASEKLLANAAEHQRAGRWAESRTAYQEILRKDPNNVNAMYQLAVVLSRMGRFEEAIEVLKHVVEIAPKFDRAWTDLSIAFQMRDLYDEAIQSAERAVELAPNQTRSLMVLGESYFQNGETDKAISTYQQGLDIEPDSVPLLSALGTALRTAGRQQDAIRCFETCISNMPSLGEAYYNLANLKTYRFSEEQLASMKAQLANDALRVESLVNFHFALGKAFEDRENYDESFRHYQAGNILRHKQKPYESRQVDDTHERIRKVFSGDLTKRIVTRPHATEDVVPIFIVGLPRSGSTLIEQILASHSLVEGTRELPTLGRVVQTLNVDTGGVNSYPETFENLSPDSMRELGNHYLELTRSFRTDRPYFIDKMPNNFSFIGAIRGILPQAKIINACRHPLSTCVSTYKQLFFGGQVFSYRLSDIAHYYLHYQRLMNYWREVFPGFILDVRYENMIDDQEAETRRLLDFCDLPFEESCMRFYETDRAVITASSEQVRQPIYTSSIDVWRPYERHIGELIEALKPLLMDLPEKQRPQSLLD